MVRRKKNVDNGETFVERVKRLLTSDDDGDGDD